MLNGLIIDQYGDKFWYKDDILIRSECIEGNKFFFKNGKYHSEIGPAIKWSNGGKEWWVEGKRHRIDGPAIECPNRFKEWWYEGEKIECKSQKEFERIIKLKMFW